MATLTADTDGVLRGKFTIPADVPAGSKLVSFLGAGGSNGSAVFTGQGLVERQTMQELITLTQVRAPRHVDPLAQTFMLDERAHCVGIELYVTEVGSTPIVVQIRETQVGFPTTTIVAESILKPADIAEGDWNRWEFVRPIELAGGAEYAIVVLCNDANGAIAVAELGSFDQSASRWVTNQPYNVGVLLSSSNASTWTAHQDRDMAFRLLTAGYTESERVIDLGSVSVTDATDLIVLSPSIQAGSQADSDVVLNLPNGDSISANDRQVVRVSPAITGDIGISARLRSDNGLSAVLLPGTRVVSGEVQTSADYVSRAIPADATGVDVRILFDAYLPSGANATVWVSDADDEDWQQVSQTGSARPLGNSVFEYQYDYTNLQAAQMRVKLEIEGTPSARPQLANLRVSVI